MHRLAAAMSRPCFFCILFIILPVFKLLSGYELVKNGMFVGEKRLPVE
jgi:hypothetical protein